MAELVTGVVALLDPDVVTVVETEVVAEVVAEVDAGVALCLKL